MPSTKNALQQPTTQETKELIDYCVRYAARDLLRLLDQKHQEPSANQREFLRACHRSVKELKTH